MATRGSALSTMALKFQNIRKTFQTAQGSVWALGGLSLDVPANSFTAVVGPSGCGKTTLLHIAACLDTQFEGEFEVTAGAYRKAYLFQSPRLLPWLTTEQNVSFVLESHGEKRNAALATARQYLQL